MAPVGAPLPTDGISPDFLAVSDFVKGSMTYQTGPLVYSRSCTTADGSFVEAGDAADAGESYRLQVIYDEALNAVGTVEVQAVCAGSGAACTVTDLVWYGSQEYLLADSFNPHVLEFTVTPGGNTADWCVFTVQGLTGSASALKAAPFRLPLSDSPEEELRQNLLERFLSAAGKEDAATPVTRGMVAEVLWRLCGTPILESETMYTDVQPGTNRAMALTWAEANGLIQGYGDGRVGTEDVLSREQAAVILLRYAQILGSDISIQGDLTAWSDGDAVSYWARDGVLWAVNAGILDTSAASIPSGADGHLRGSAPRCWPRHWEAVCRRCDRLEKPGPACGRGPVFPADSGFRRAQAPAYRLSSRGAASCRAWDRRGPKAPHWPDRIISTAWPWGRGS